MKSSSKIVTSNQKGVHENLHKVIEKHRLDNYGRPISDFSQKTFKEIITWIDQFPNEIMIILDLGCGVGESSFQLAAKYPESLVIGIDRSVKRLETKNDFKKEAPTNLLLIRGELLDLWYLFAMDKSFPKNRLVKQYILYPNPSPKSKDLSRRWHGNPIAPFIFELESEIELRSNWKNYLDEFLIAADFYGFKGEVQDFECLVPITPFERKYLASEHKLFRLILKKGE